MRLIFQKKIEISIGKNEETRKKEKKNFFSEIKLFQTK